MAKSQSRIADMVRNAEDALIINQGGAVMPMEDEDIESAWDDWTEALKGSDGGGMVRAYKVPQDENGNPLTNAKGAKQTYLGAWPHQAYDFDSLLQMITQRFLRPGESCFVRLTGVRAGSGGLQFNKIVSLQRDSTAPETASGSGGDLGAVMQAVQKMNEQNALLMERLTTRNEPPPKDNTAVMEVVKASIPVLGTVLAAWIGRPAQKSDLGELITALGKLKGFVGDGKGGGDDSDDSTLGIVKAIGPHALQLLTALAQRQPQPVPAPRRIPSRQLPPPRAPISAPQPSAENGGATAATASTAPHSTTSQPSTENEQMLAQLAPQLAQLAELASRNEDPAEVAKLVLGVVPEEYDDQLYNLISDAQAFGRLALLSPELKPHKEWLERLRVSMLAEYEPDNAPSPAPAPV